MKYFCQSCKAEVGEPVEGIVQVGIKPKTRKPAFIEYTDCKCGMVTYRYLDGRRGIYNPATQELQIAGRSV